MKTGITIGQVWGIPIRLDWSWFFIFALVTWSLAGGYLPGAYPDLGTGALWLLGALTSVLVFGSVLLHELGHAYVAQRNGIAVRGISLFIFGGVAALQSEPRTPGAEFRIAIAGPIVSFALAVLFGGLYLLDRHIPLLAAPSVWLAEINLLLAMFNMIPGFPLDGGRVLRAAVWRWSGNEWKATKVAAFTGQLVAWGFVGYGFVLLLVGSFVGGLWMALIGWFLLGAARTSVAQKQVQQQLHGVAVGQVMNRTVPHIESKLPLDQLVNEYVVRGGQRSFVVQANGHGPGLVTLREIKATPRARWRDMTAADVMVPLARLHTIAPDTHVLAALDIMEHDHAAHVPVVANGQVVGLFGHEQVLQYVRARAEAGV